MNKKKLTVIFPALAVISIIMSTCDLTLPEKGPAADGIVIYWNREILNDREVEVVEKRNQQLRATCPAGQNIVWNSSNPGIIDVDQKGFLRVGQGINKTSVVSAVLKEDPSVKAEVLFRVKGLR